MGGAVALLVAAHLASAYDPVIDQARLPPAGLSVGAGVQRLHDDFGLFLRVASPRFLDDHFGVALAGGVGWYPDLRALPANAASQDFGAWSTYAHARLCAELSTSLVPVSGRLYAKLGPSFLWLSSRLSTTRLGIGVFGAVGAEQVLVHCVLVFFAAAAGHAAQVFPYVEAREGALLFLLFRL